MSTQKGTINVQTENIFPIIKKYLYSDHEIFLRELVSNAVDATQKLKTLSNRGEVAGDIGDPQITISLDSEAGTLTVSDQGIGMSEAEVDKYINQIAFSGAKEFLETYEDDNAIIGHFGLGFYSSFMVSDKVEIVTRSHREEDTAVSWSCDGSPEYIMDTAEKTERGTDIILHINEESKEFLETARVQTLLDKYCKFLPVAINFNDKVINNPSPLWTKSPSELKDEDYLAFYKELYPFSEDPLFWIHLNVDHPFKLTGVLYFPKMKQFDVKKEKIMLFQNQVFVTDAVEEIVPEFMTLLHGVIDSPDIPLNVSRSYLQSDPNVKKINGYISKKVADKLKEIFDKDREGFETKWEHTGIFIKYGMLSDEKFHDRAMPFCLVKDTENKFYTLEEYKEAVKDQQTDKNDNLILLYSNDVQAQDSFIASAAKKDYNVLDMSTIIDTHFVGHLEQKLEKTNFKRVDADTVDKLVDKDEKFESLLTTKEEESVKSLFTRVAGRKATMVEMKALSPDDQPVIITKPELMRRFEEMQRYNNAGAMPDFGGMYNIVVNSNHPMVAKLAEDNATNVGAKTKQLYDLALLSQGMLSGSELTSFINRSHGLMDGQELPEYDLPEVVVEEPAVDTAEFNPADLDLSTEEVAEALADGPVVEDIEDAVIEEETVDTKATEADSEESSTDTSKEGKKK